MMTNGWEYVTEERLGGVKAVTGRLAVPGGWLYRVVRIEYRGPDEPSVVTIAGVGFVARPPAEVPRVEDPPAQSSAP